LLTESSHGNWGYPHPCWVHVLVSAHWCWDYKTYQNLIAWQVGGMDGGRWGDCQQEGDGTIS
jgi:hypothetical protein